MTLQNTFLPIAATLVLSIGLSDIASASHDAAAEIFYKCLGGNDYEVGMVFYQDCSTAGAVPQTRSLTMASSSCAQSMSVSLSIQDTSEVNIGCSAFGNYCPSGGGGLLAYYYKDTVTLPMACADWVFSTSFCCRNSSNSNLANSNTTSTYYEARLNSVLAPCNTSPVFQQVQQPFVALNALFCLDNAAYDPDGDSLVYSMSTVYDGDASFPANYAPGYSPADPFPTATGHSFDPVTGNHCAIPAMQGNYAVAYNVNEYRNGVWIASTLREIQLIVVNLPSAVLDITGTVTDTSGVPLTSGDVELFEYGLNAMGSTFLGAQPISATGTYSFLGLPGGQYIVRASPDTLVYANMASSYHQSTHYWSYADMILALCDTTLQADIQLVGYNNLNGTGYLAGYLGDLGINRSSVGTPWPGVSVILENWPQRDLVAFTKTSSTGHYVFNNVPDGEYRVIMDHPGLPMYGFYRFTVDATHQIFDELDYAAEPHGFYPAPEALNLNDHTAVELILSPNPVGAGNMVTLMGLEDGETLLTVEDLMGRQVQAKTVRVSSAKAVLELNDLSPGTYIVRVNNGTTGMRLIKE